ncbi:hypothetical protein [Chryseobacterium viscerum]|uniref:Gliding motility-associated C-terminal domain-containing protein n=1 Tax=Chryseobacterium viscerum TaxID=1037377 RepID=A0A5N4BSH0_9FLAO|nr:hypothetical protein [Chryseobacterium viscerum]KAB1231342.1 hypothetical protein F8D52_05915 [Chryseobacterium viscerum]
MNYEYPPASGTMVTYDINNPLPQSGDKVELKDIQIPGTYNLEVKLAIGNVTTKTNATLVVDRCTAPSSCGAPVIKSVEVLKDGQIVMDYWVDINDFVTLEYQIATDSNFTNIIYVKGAFDYAQLEYIDMKSGKIPNNTQLYIRIRKYCKSNGISDWSDVVTFQSGAWKSPLEVRCIAKGDDLSEDLCYDTIYSVWRAEVTLSTDKPMVGSLIYLPNGKLAIPGNIKDFYQNAPDNFKNNGILWIRFVSVNPSSVYVVKPETAEIIEITQRLKC